MERSRYKRIVIYAKDNDLSNLKKAKANCYAVSSLLLKLLNAYIKGKIDPNILQSD